MTLWSMIVAVVAISVIGGIIMQYLKGKEKGVDYDLDGLAEKLGLGDGGGMSKKALKPYLDRIDQLEERVRVLERIATDKGRSLADEIDQL
ncbi:hypothetical protein [Paremcibacter congregatus]|uniref:Uncharacterized protein n=1 Tax=Paremcibacter congregatus TaxID=2043170 RepID=A0A2G4YR99_9PROT|nr:hypothetical protein [Paremcibacter congregatus]PHZ84859.1 hypothetical protein CRD36_09030 [Paremcibacter congregatus]QDE26167.1 hypothetical protein FIV45_02115 [Paremcibacter congregatus]